MPPRFAKCPARAGRQKQPLWICFRASELKCTMRALLTMAFVHHHAPAGESSVGEQAVPL